MRIQPLRQPGTQAREERLASAARAGQHRPSHRRRAGQLRAQSTTASPSTDRQKLFGSIAPVYDELNNSLSFGQHYIWKRLTADWSGAKAGSRCLDVCCGSGDLAFLLAKRASSSGQVTALDFAPEMLSYARSRAGGEQKQGSAEVSWTLGDALQLPFEGYSFDAVTMGYGLRNVADVAAALRELRRVLRPGCKAAVLDFNNSENPLVRGAQGLALDAVVVPAAAQYGLRDEYAYLRPSIARFPTGREQTQLAKGLGFSAATHFELAFGLMGVLVLTK